MQIYENGGRTNRKPTCSYCRNPDHRAKDCPQAPIDWAYWQQKQIPPHEPAQHWWKQPRYWGEWYTKCEATILKQQEWAAKQAQPKTARKAKARKCGFCGSPDHNRRACPTMRQFIADCYTANENWRRAAYKTLVEDHGIYVGAAIKVKEARYYGSGNPEPQVALVTDVNFDKLNLLCARNGYDGYNQLLQITVNVAGHSRGLQFYNRGYRSTPRDTTAKEQSFTECFAKQGYHSLDYVSSISNNATPLDPSWITDYRDAFDWLAKKRSLVQLNEMGITGLVETWKERGEV